MKILIIDDEPLVAKTLKRLLRSYDVTVIHSPSEATEFIRSSNPDLIFCDLMMPDLSGSELFEIICEHVPEHKEKFVFITGGAFSEEAEAFLSSPGKRVLYKPFNRVSLQKIVDDTEVQLGP